MSARNLAKAQHFRPETLERKRTDFYLYLRDATSDMVDDAQIVGGSGRMTRVLHVVKTSDGAHWAANQAGCWCAKASKSM